MRSDGVKLPAPQKVLTSNLELLTLKAGVVTVEADRWRYRKKEFYT